MYNFPLKKSLFDSNSHKLTLYEIKSSPNLLYLQAFFICRFSWKKNSYKKICTIPTFWHKFSPQTRNISSWNENLSGAGERERIRRRSGRKMKSEGCNYLLIFILDNFEVKWHISLKKLVVLVTFRGKLPPRSILFHAWVDSASVAAERRGNVPTVVRCPHFIQTIPVHFHSFE